ncbi:hypothetical protein QTI33_26445 [Variovorax sp. J22P271]|uniref:hypothetical protein n=1 Tax=Variovorax davisae TaxID=3053515 RepID=UPI0025770F82|nr:hypothetical protein [Variovorax sp. J22P271]MDM0035701.1 hypothetical protein [Variovorax sp. J22P271]
MRDIALRIGPKSAVRPNKSFIRAQALPASALSIVTTIPAVCAERLDARKATMVETDQQEKTAYRAATRQPPA